MSFEAIRNLYPQVMNFDEKYGYFDVNEKEVEIDSNLVDKEVKRLQDEYNALAYSRKHEAEYPSIQECVHAILDDDLVALQEKRQAVKTKYPKS